MLVFLKILFDCMYRQSSIECIIERPGAGAAAGAISAPPAHRKRRARHRRHTMSAPSLSAVAPTDFGWYLTLVHERGGGAPGAARPSAMLQIFTCAMIHRSCGEASALVLSRGTRLYLSNLALTRPKFTTTSTNLKGKPACSGAQVPAHAILTV